MLKILTSDVGNHDTVFVCVNNIFCDTILKYTNHNRHWIFPFP